MKTRKLWMILIALLLLILCLSSCSKQGKCELCGNYGTLHKANRHGSSAWLCETCYDAVDVLTFIFG